MFYLKISGTNTMNLFSDFYHLSNFPQGGKVFAPSPVGESLPRFGGGWEGG